MIESCRRRGLDPFAYLRAVLTRLPKSTKSRTSPQKPGPRPSAQTLRLNLRRSNSAMSASPLSGSSDSSDFRAKSYPSHGVRHGAYALAEETVEQLDLADLLAAAVRHFDPHASTVDEKAIEAQWASRLRLRLGQSESNFRSLSSSLATKPSGSPGVQSSQQFPLTAVLRRLRRKLQL